MKFYGRSLKHLTYKTVFLLAIALGEGQSEAKTLVFNPKYMQLSLRALAFVRPLHWTLRLHLKHGGTSHKKIPGRKLPLHCKQPNGYKHNHWYIKVPTHYDNLDLESDV